jgi:hypothetical protein
MIFSAHVVGPGIVTSVSSCLYWALSPICLRYSYVTITATNNVCEPGGSVSMVPGCGQDDRAIWVLYPAEAKCCTSSPPKRLRDV